MDADWQGKERQGKKNGKGGILLRERQNWNISVLNSRGRSRSVSYVARALGAVKRREKQKTGGGKLWKVVARHDP